MRLCCLWAKAIVIVAVVAWAPANLRADSQVKTVDFERQIAPIVLRHCAGCHNPADQAGGLNLLSPATAFAAGKSGEPAIKPGSVDESYIVTRIEVGEMPPQGKGPPITRDELAALKRWIETGAVWPPGRQLDPLELTTDLRAGRDWWSLGQPKRPPLPTVKNAAWPRTPIDAFVLAKLEEHGLKPATAADRTTLIRRAKLDLLGLPPTPEEIQAFVADAAPNAYEKLVDRFLASPAYGERWARHWLDVVRFAESNGFETNLARPNAWPYRDYVIDSLNSDKPYDKFIAEQLAGDQVGADVATGFLVGGPWDSVKSPDEQLTRMQRLGELDDMVSTTCTAFLGLTAGCAKCHDHKFDPIMQRDYYALSAIFSGVQHGEREIAGAQGKANAERRAAINREIAELQSEQRRLVLDQEPVAQIGDAAKSTTRRRNPVDPRGNIEKFSAVTAKFLRFTVRATNNLEPCIDELEIFSAGESPRNVALASAGAQATASGVFQDGKYPLHQLAHINDGRYGNARSWISNETGRGWVQIELPSPTLIDRIEWARDRQGQFDDRLPTSYVIEVAREPGQWQTVATSDDRAAYVAGAKTPPIDVEQLPPAPAQRYRALEEKRKQLDGELATVQPQMAYAGKFAEPPEPTYRLHRGDPMQRREEIAPGAILAVGKSLAIAANTPEAQRRLALAHWIADPQNPLTARVMVNRLWHYHFGQGLMRNPSDFGFNGGRPSHPELLDWLATQLVAGGWRLKHIHRLIMLSSTYRQSHEIDAKQASVDGGNLWLWHFRSRRLEAEPIRDCVLAVSGALDSKAGGPGFDVFEPNDNYVKVYTPKQSFGPAEWRRAIYLSKPRMQFDATFGAFDCPDSAQPLAKRNSSTTALQALNLLNSPFMLQQADLLAKRLEREAAGEPAAQARRAFWLAFGRDPEANELKESINLISTSGLPSFCRALLNANEFVYLP